MRIAEVEEEKAQPLQSDEKNGMVTKLTTRLSQRVNSKLDQATWRENKWEQRSSTSLMYEWEDLRSRKKEKNLQTISTKDA